MYIADSDIVGVLVIIVTLGIGLYNMISKKSSSNNAGRDVRPNVDDPDIDDNDNAIEMHSDLEEMFASILSPKIVETERQKNKIDNSGNESREHFENISSNFNDAPKSVMFNEGGSLITSDLDSKEINSESEEKSRNRLKNRLKENKQDIIIYSEILNPKFKEF